MDEILDTKMNFLDLFSGIGGFALGAYWAGMRFDNHYYSEVDPYAIDVYSHRFPDAISLGDIRGIRGADLPRGEWIIAGGFPCQDISVAGKGAGLAGARSGLWYEYARLIGELRPRFAIMENVGALAFRGLDSVLGSLAKIGYDAEWQDIRASDVGAPHRRERIWIVAYPNTWNAQCGQGQRPRIWGTKIGEGTNNNSCGSSTPNVPESDNGGRREHVQPQRELGSGEALADAQGAGQLRTEQLENDSKGQSRRGAADTYPEGKIRSQDVANLDSHDVQGIEPRCADAEEWEGPEQGQAGSCDAGQRGQWATEPDVCGMVDGISPRLDGGINASARMDSERHSRAMSEIGLRNMWDEITARATSSGRESDEQLARELGNAVPGLSYALTLGERESGLENAPRFVLRLRQACEALGALRDSSEPLSSAWESLSDKEKDRAFLGAMGRADWTSGEWIGVPRVAKSIPARVDRLKCLGNSIVPQIAELIFRGIKEELSINGGLD